MTYHFDTEHARKYGVDEAIVLQNMIFWITTNRANERHEHEVEIDGELVRRTWTYNSKRAFSELFPFWTEKQIRRILDSLVEQDVVVTGRFNNTPYDRTLWYALKDEGLLPEVRTSISPNGPIERPEQSSESAQTDRPIPDTNTDRKQDEKRDAKVPLGKLPDTREEAGPRNGGEKSVAWTVASEFYSEYEARMLGHPVRAYGKHVTKITAWMRDNALSKGQVTRIQTWYFDNWKRLHKEWGAQGKPSMDVMIGFVRDFSEPLGEETGGDEGRFSDHALRV